MSEAKQLCEQVLEIGEEINSQPLTVVVLDQGGHLLCALRSERSGIMRYEVAYGKAWGALGMGFGTRVFSEMVDSSASYQSFVHALSTMSGGKVVPVPGGVLLRNSNGDLLGAIGVSGDSSDRDEQCILRAISQMKMIAQP
ncbi:MAG: heme-binding protein [Reichenbachiella sp.]